MPTPLFDPLDYARNHAPPPNYRLPKWIAYFQSLLSGLSRCMFIFRAYKGGETLLYWSSAATYNTGDSVVYNFKSYESLVDGNTNIAPDTDTDSWIVRCNSFIGADERLRFSGKHMNFEWALNRYFKYQLEANGFVGYKQPTAYTDGTSTGIWATPTSDIYITTDVPAFATFVMADTWYTSSEMGGTESSPYFMDETPVYAAASTYKFTIHIPTAVFNDLGSTTTIRESIVRQFADKYCASGLQYSIVTY